MSTTDRSSAPLQLSLFPDEFEVQAAAVVALKDLDLRRARTLLDRVRRQNPRLVNLAVIGAALDLLETVLPEARVQPSHLARAFLAAHDAWLAGRLVPAAAQFVDEVIAGCWRRRGSHATFLDDEARVHRGLVDLVTGDVRAAGQHLAESLDTGLEHRADLWAYCGDALLRSERADDANACYVRALLLDASAVDLLRTSLRPLAALYQELRPRLGDGLARETLIVHAWLDRIVDIPPDNGWLDGQTARLELRSVTEATVPPEQQRCRRFAWLLYLDRSQPASRVDIARREEMADLDPDLFARVMHEAAARESARGR